MYIPPADRADEPEWRALVEAADVVEVIAPGAGRQWPVVAPVHAAWDGERFACHFARPNPIWEALEEAPRAVVSLHGGWAYIHGGWKAAPGTPAELGVPTSFYWAVQLFCTAEIVDDPDELAGVLRELVAKFEGSADALADPASAHRGRLGAIRGLLLSPGRVQAKIKVGGNQSPAVQQRIRDELARRASPADRALVGLIDARARRR